MWRNGKFWPSAHDTWDLVFTVQFSSFQQWAKGPSFGAFSSSAANLDVGETHLRLFLLILYDSVLRHSWDHSMGVDGVLSTTDKYVVYTTGRTFSTQASHRCPPMGLLPVSRPPFHTQGPSSGPDATCHPHLSLGRQGRLNSAHPELEPTSLLSLIQKYK